MGRLERANSTSCRTGRSGDQDNPLSPMHGRMRAIDRDLIREGHYGQRSCEPRKQAEHMAAPTNAAYVQESPCQLGAVHTWGYSGHDFLHCICPLLTLIVALLRDFGAVRQMPS